MKCKFRKYFSFFISFCLNQNFEEYISIVYFNFLILNQSNGMLENWNIICEKHYYLHTFYIFLIFDDIYIFIELTCNLRSDGMIEQTTEDYLFGKMCDMTYWVGLSVYAKTCLVWNAFFLQISMHKSAFLLFQLSF